jgi:hypothetical protein
MDEKNKNRFNHLRYQLKKSGNSSSTLHHQRDEIVPQNKGSYAFPSNDSIENDYSKKKEFNFKKNLIRPIKKTKG